MRKGKKLISVGLILIICTGMCSMLCACGEEPYAYLFVHFIGNLPEEEVVYYALSRDGYNFTQINNGKPILVSQTGTGGVRDPFILRLEGGGFVMLGTDMHAEYGWDSNRNILSWYSDDLVTWREETLIPMVGTYSILDNSYCAWAPQAIYNAEREEYMLYFTAGHPDVDERCIYYCYTKDFKELTSTPEILFADAKTVIDADIIQANGMYYMFYKTARTDGVKLVQSTTIDGGYAYARDVFTIGCEGSCVYQTQDSNSYTVMADIYWAGKFTMAQTTNFVDFTIVDESRYSFDFLPRHGYVVELSRKEYRGIVRSYGKG